MLTNQSFVDPQGQTFTDAVIRVNNATRVTDENSNVRDNFIANLRDRTAESFSNTDSNTYSDDSVTCSFAYWTSQEAYDNELLFYPLSNPEGENASFYINKEELAKPVYDGLTREKVCETYLTPVILPTMGA